ncbi:MAG: hypothetical protein LJE59_14200 [Chromatiaceae bacterium]|nr:hypothetical protein [Chromatiaceae bacterium]
MMNTTTLPRMILSGCLAAAILATAGCSGSREDPRITLCKNLTTALQPGAQSVEWTGNENSFRRPEYAVIALTFDVVDANGKRSAMRSACHYEYEALDDTALNLANPFLAYATLPFKMTLNDKALSDADLVKLVNAEQRRLGNKAVDTLKKGASDMADKVRAGIGH